MRPAHLLSLGFTRFAVGFGLAVILAILALVLIPTDAPLQAAEGGAADEAITPPPDPPSLLKYRSIGFGTFADGRLTTLTAKSASL